MDELPGDEWKHRDAPPRQWRPKPEEDFDVVNVMCCRCRAVRELEKKEFFLVHLLFDLERYICPPCTAAVWPKIQRVL